MQESPNKKTVSGRKVIHIGRSLGLTLPKKLATDAGLEAGTPLTITQTKDGLLIRKDDSQIDPLFMKNLELGIQRYTETLTYLRKGDE